MSRVSREGRLEHSRGMRVTRALLAVTAAGAVGLIGMMVLAPQAVPFAPQVNAAALPVQGAATVGTSGATVYLATDHLCGACQRFHHGALPGLLDAAERGEARLVFLPLLGHGDASLRGAVAAECAWRHGGAAGFLNTERALYADPGLLNFPEAAVRFLPALVREGAGDAAAACATPGGEEHGQVQAAVRERHRQSLAAGVRRTPYISVEGREVQPIWTLIRSALQRAGR